MYLTRSCNLREIEKDVDLKTNSDINGWNQKITMPMVIFFWFRSNLDVIVRKLSKSGQGFSFVYLVFWCNQNLDYKNKGKGANLTKHAQSHVESRST